MLAEVFEEFLEDVYKVSELDLLCFDDFSSLLWADIYRKLHGNKDLQIFMNEEHSKEEKEALEVI